MNDNPIANKCFPGIVQTLLTGSRNWKLGITNVPYIFFNISEVEVDVCLELLKGSLSKVFEIQGMQDVDHVIQGMQDAASSRSSVQ